MPAGGQLRISVVIPAYRAQATLPAVLEALGPQVDRSGGEAILVDSSGGAEIFEITSPYRWLRVVALPDRCLPGRARNIGAAQAGGELLVFLDADAVPAPDWLDRLASSLTPGTDAVAGAILNGTPWHPIGTAGYLLEFSDWLPRRRAKVAHGASANLLVRKAAFDAAGGFAEDLFPGEDTVLTFRIGQRGRLGFAPDAGVHHLNRTSWREFVLHQRRLGAAFAGVCDRTAFPHRWVSRPLVAPLAAPLRLAALARRVARSPAEAVQAVAFLPLLVAGSGAWAAGVARHTLTRQ